MPTYKIDVDRTLTLEELNTEAEKHGLTGGLVRQRWYRGTRGDALFDPRLSLSDRAKRGKLKFQLNRMQCRKNPS